MRSMVEGAGSTAKRGAGLLHRFAVPLLRLRGGGSQTGARRDHARPRQRPVATGVCWVS